jgi:hypothetical protein
MKRWSARLVTRTKQYNREQHKIESEQISSTADLDNMDEDGSEQESDDKEDDSGSKNQRKQRVLTIADLQVSLVFQVSENFSYSTSIIKMINTFRT